MNLVSALQSEKKLVDVRGFEPLTPCLQSAASAPTIPSNFSNYYCFQQIGASDFRSKVTPIDGEDRVSAQLLHSASGSQNVCFGHRRP